MRYDQVAFGWSANSYFGWGVTGINWMLRWPGMALSAMPDFAVEFPPGDKRVDLLSLRLGQSLAFQSELGVGSSLSRPIPCFVGLGSDFISHPVAGGFSLSGTPTIAVVFFEDLALAEASIDRLKVYPLVLTASMWNQDFLIDRGISTARLCHQGYDPVLFHPGVRRSRSDGRFRVFSGGKAEYRKGQDIVLRAFARFAERHDDAVLVAAWGSPWPGMAQNLAQAEFGAPPGAELGLPNFRAWAQRAGIKPHQIEIVPPRANWRMAEIYGGVDCAIFPNRAEGGTNLVAMECMACGVPTIIEDTTGQRDLRYDAVASLDTGGDPDAWVELLETRYYLPPLPRALGSEWAWPTRMKTLTHILDTTEGEFLPSVVSTDRLAEMARLAAQAPPGALVEVGVYKGGSAQILYRIAREKGEDLHLFDTFSGIPVSDATHGDQHKIGEFGDVDLAAMRLAMPFAKFHVGTYPATHEDVGKIAFIHCDCDQYESYRAVIDRMWPMVVPGGVVLFDDYPYLEGARRAVLETFDTSALQEAGSGRFFTRKS